MSDAFHKFPHTPHLLWLGEGVPRVDKVLSAGEANAFLDGPLIVEEKVDGANLGISVDSTGRLRGQSRGNYLAPGLCHAQWNALWPWLAQQGAALVEALGDELVLFGEWCYARHTIVYSRLPAWFLAFDVYDRKHGRFWSVANRDALVAKLGIPTVPNICQGPLALDQVAGLIGASRLGALRMEGIYLRREGDGYLQQRAKVVGSEFMQQIEEHWTRRPLVLNQLSASSVRVAP